MRFFDAHRIISAVAVTATCFVAWWFFVSEDQPADAIKKAYVSGDYEQVRNLARGLELPRGTQPEVWLLAGQACRHLTEYEEAISYFHKTVVDAGTSSVAVDAALQAAAILEELGRHSDAVSRVTELVSRHPDDAELHRSAARLLDLVGRRQEANIHHLALVKAGQYTVDDLILLANRHEPFAASEVEEALRDPHSSLFRVTRALVLWQSGKLAEAAALLRVEIVKAPDSLSAHALLELSIAKGDFAFTLCQIPVIYHCGEERKLVIGYATSEAVVRQRLTLTDDESTSVIFRRGEINRIDVYFAASSFG